MLWLIATVAAETVLVPSADAESLFEALGTASDGDVFLLTKEYTPSMEDQTAVTGVLVDRSVTIASDVEGEARPAPGLLISKSDVTLIDLEPQVIIGAFGNARGGYGQGLSETGAVTVHGGSVTLERVAFRGLERTTLTWAPLLVQDGDATLTDVTVQDCTAATSGSVGWAGYAVVVEIDDGQAHQVQVTNLTVADDDMAGIWLQETDGALSASVHGSTLEGLKARDTAPGIQGAGVTLTVSETQFVDLASSLGAGALGCSDCSVATSGVGFIRTQGYYGAVDLQGGQGLIDKTKFEDCQGTAGAAMSGADTAWVLHELDVIRPRAEDGAVAYLQQGTIEGTDVSVFDAQAQRGGLFWLSQVPTAAFTRLSVCQVHTSNGGAIRGAGGSHVSLENAVLQQMTGNGVVDLDGTLDAQNVSVVGNTADFLVGIPLQIRLVNVLFSGNGALGELFLDDAEIHHNLYWDNASPLSVGSHGAGTSTVDADPRFRTPQTSGDCLWQPLLGVGSPAIDTGDDALQDLDGTRSDIGAYGGQNAWDVPPIEDTGGPDTGPDSGDTGDSGAPQASAPVLGGGCPGVLPASMAGLLVLPWLARRRS